MGARPPGRGPLLVAVVFALSCFLATLFVYTQFGGQIPFGARGYRIHVSFAQAATLTSNADVRISGVPVGKVIEATPHGERTDALLQIDRRFAPLPSDAHAILRSKTLLGETFVELTPGTPSAPKLKEGGRLSTQNVEPTQQLDEVLSAFDRPTRQSFKRFLIDLSAGLKGRSGDLSAAVGNAAPATEDLTTLVQLLDQQQSSVERLIHDGGGALRALGRRESDLQSLVTAGDQVLSTTAAHDRALTATVRALPPFLAQLRPTLAAVGVTATAAAPTLRVLRPVAPLVRPGLVSASALAPQLTAAFKELRPVIAAARSGLPAATRVVTAARPLVDVLYPAGRELVPVVQLLEVYRQEAVMFLANLGNATQASTPQPNGPPLHYIRTLIPFGNESVVGYPRRLGSNRHNAYFAPGAIANLAHGGLKAFDCRNIGNPQTLPIIGSGAPPCMVQGPWTFRGQSRAFPHVELDGP